MHTKLVEVESADYHMAADTPSCPHVTLRQSLFQVVNLLLITVHTEFF